MRALAGLLLFLSSTFCQVLAQNGGYYITHHSPQLESIDNTNFDILQDQNGMLCIANRKGVLIYDGLFWDHVETPSSVFSLGLGTDNTLYLGCRDGFGMIERGNNGANYKSLSTGYDISDVFSIEATDSLIYFLSELTLMVYSKSKNEIEKVIQGPRGFYFNSIFQIDGKVYVDIELDGVYEVTSAGLERAPEFPEKTDIVFTSKNPNSDELITLTGDNEFMLLRSGKLWTLAIDNSDFIAESEITDLTWVNDTLIVVTTLQSGCLLVNPIKRSLVGSIDYSKGLVDNEIYAVTQDSDQGVWVLHNQGLSRIDTGLPIYNYGIYPGLEGNILSVYHDSLLYVGTSSGLFVLKKVKRFEEVEFEVEVDFFETYTVEVPEEKKETVAKEGEEDIDLQDLGDVKVKKRKKGFLKILGKKDKKKKDEAVPAQEEVVEVVKVQPDKPRTRTVRRSNTRTETRTKKELRSERFEFSRMQELGVRCDQIISWNGSIMVLSSKGIHEVHGTKVSQVSDLKIKKFYITRDNRWIVAVLSDDQVALIGREEEGWAEPRVFDFLYDEIFSITEDLNSNLWLIGSTNVYKAIINNGELDILERYDLDNPYYDEYFPFVGKESIYLVSASKYSVFNASQNSFTTRPADSIWGNQIERMIQDGRDLWVSNGERWTAMSKNIPQNNLQLLMLWKNISQISRVNEQLWVVTEENELHRMDMKEPHSLNWSNNLMLKEVRNRSVLLDLEKELSIQSRNNSVSFEFRYPGYLNQDDLRFQFALRGPANSFSGWTKNNTVSFSYLPAGRYELSVKSRNGAGEIVEGDLYRFKIIPPYWERPWFYALEASFFGFLLYLSIRLNRKNPGNFISKLLAFFTLILIIEFIQTSAEARIVTDSSLFITFLVNAGIALIIFPFERLLRSFIIRSKEKSS